jgi:hypothetical protein
MRASGWSPTLKQPEIEMMTCRDCSSAFSSYSGVMDLCIQVQRPCWSDARMIADDGLVHRFVAKFHRAALEELVDEYVDAHPLPERLLDAWSTPCPSYARRQRLFGQILGRIE